MNQVGDDEAEAAKAWLDDAGFTFHFGADGATELTLAQVRSQFKMYIAAVRLADDFGADARATRTSRDSRTSCRYRTSPRAF